MKEQGKGKGLALITKKKKLLTTPIGNPEKRDKPNRERGEKKKKKK